MKKRKIVVLLISMFFMVLLLSACDNTSSNSTTTKNQKSESTTECVHTWESATCTKPKTCSSCKTTEGNTLEHNYTEAIVTVATCEQDGTKNYTCSLCSNSYTESYSLPVYTATEIHNMYSECIGEIITYDKTGKELALGSCFVYSNDGKIITNFHVIDGANSIKVTINGNVYPVQYILAYDKDIDLAVIQINASKLNSVKICQIPHKVGQEIYAFGSSKGLTATFSKGIITYSNRELNGVVYTQHDAAISSGNSGGPLINLFGEVIGINTLTIKDSQNLNFAISISEVNKLSYGTPLTVSEFYEKEYDHFSKLKNYIIKNGTYKSSKNQYELTLYDYSSGSTIRRVFYDNSSDEIIFSYYSKGSSGSSSLAYLVSIYIDNTLDGVYDWNYVDSEDYYMLGTLYASTFTNNTLLGYSSNNIPSYLRSTIRQLASISAIAMCTAVDLDFTDIDVTAKDLGFLNF